MKIKCRKEESIPERGGGPEGSRGGEGRATREEQIGGGRETSRTEGEEEKKSRAEGEEKALTRKIYPANCHNCRRQQIKASNCRRRQIKASNCRTCRRRQFSAPIAAVAVGGIWFFKNRCSSLRLLQKSIAAIRVAGIAHQFGQNSLTIYIYIYIYIYNKLTKAKSDKP